MASVLLLQRLRRAKAGARQELPHVARRHLMGRYGLYTYEQAGERLGYSPNYVRWLTRTGDLGYVVKTWRRGWLLRRKRFIPYEEILAFELERLKRILGPAMQEVQPEMLRQRRGHRRPTGVGNFRRSPAIHRASRAPDALGSSARGIALPNRVRVR
jgi:hypothetical protein